MPRPDVPSVQERRIKEIHHVAQGYPAKSFQEGLHTVLDLADEALEAGLHLDFGDLTASLPEELALAATTIKTEVLDDPRRFRSVYNLDEDRSVLNLVSRINDRPVLTIAVYYAGADRQNPRVDFRYRNPGGMIALGARLRSRDGALAVEYRIPETSELKETTLVDGTDAAERVGEHLGELVEEAYEHWGEGPEL